MRVGNVRTSKKDQSPELQRRDLVAAGCEKIFEEQISSRKVDRPELRAALEYVREGDALVVWKLDRFGRSLKELIELVGYLRERGVEFVSLRESIDTTTPGASSPSPLAAILVRMLASSVHIFHVTYVFGAVAEFERDIIRERTMAGLEAARARGRKGGRKPVMDEKKLALASKMLKNREIPVGEVCEAVGVSRSTLYRHLKPDGSVRQTG